MNAEILEQIGLTKSEISVYLALLELGSSTTGKIVDKSKASSSKIYEILDKLMQKGLVSFIVKQGVKYFEAAPAERIMDYMKEKEEAFAKQREELRKILPELELKQKLAKYKSEATIFKGIKGGETAFRHMINKMGKDDEWVGFVVSFANQKYFDLLTKLHTWRAQKGLKAKIIMNERHREEGQVREKIPQTKVKYVPDELQTPAVINVAGNITLLNIMAEEVTVFMIENKEVADSFRSQFEKMWGQKVYTYQGADQIKELITKTLDFGDYNVFAEGMKIVDVLGKDFFDWWQGEKKKRGIKSKGIMGEKYRNLPTVTDSVTNFKFLPEFENPGLVFVFNNKVANVILSKDPVAFLIDNKEVADNQRSYFDLLWNQEVNVRKGINAVEETFNRMLDELNSGDEYYVLGASWMGYKDRAFKFFVDFHRRRFLKKVKAKFLFIAGTEKTVEKYKESYNRLTEIKYLPPNVYEGMQINIYKNKVLFFVWREDNPLVFSIEDKTTYNTFKTYFDTMWNQDTRVLRGLDAVQNIFEEMLVAGSVDFIGARGYFMDRRPEYINEWERRAIKRGFTMRNLVDPGVKGHRITKLPFAETKYTLTQEFSNLSVFWIYGNKVVITNWVQEEPIVVMIENKALHDMYKAQFELLWDKRI